MTKTSWLGAAILAVCSLSQAAMARATVGGPDTAQILGWSPAEKKLYYAVYFGDESGRLPRVYALDLNSSAPAEPVPILLWSETPDQRIDYAEAASRIDRLQKRLTRLLPQATDSPSMKVTTRSVKSHRHPYAGTVPEYDLEVLISKSSLKGRALLTAYCSREILIKEWYRIPQLPYAVVSIAYKGSPEETCYSRPAVILLTRDAVDK